MGIEQHVSDISQRHMYTIMKGNHEVASVKCWICVHIIGLCLFKPVFGQMNVAMGKPTAQSGPVLHSGLAVDGIMKTGFHDCSRADAGTNGRWWRVNLRNSYNINLVALTLRSADGIREADIIIAKDIGPGLSQLQDPQICQKNITTELKTGGTVFVHCNGTLQGQHVAIKNGYNWALVLCEVQVFAGLRTNLALGKRAEQISSSSLQFSADRAVDGNPNTDIKAGSCSQTTGAIQNAYWYVDLGHAYTIRAVKITTRDDCKNCDTDFKTATVYVTEASKLNPKPESYDYSEKCRDIGPLKPGLSAYVHCVQSVYGRFVYIQNNGSMHGSMTLCEVYVYGEKTTAASTNGIIPPTSSRKSSQTTLQPNPDESSEPISASSSSTGSSTTEISATTQNTRTILIAALSSLVGLVVIILIVLLVFLINKRRRKREQKSTTAGNHKDAEYEEVNDIAAEEEIEPDYSTVGGLEEPVAQSSRSETKSTDGNAVTPNNVANLYATVNKEKHSGQPKKVNAPQADVAALYAVPDKRQKKDRSGSKTRIGMKNKQVNKPNVPPNKPGKVPPTPANATDEEKLTITSAHDSNEPPEYAVVNKPKKAKGGSSDVCHITEHAMDENAYDNTENVISGAETVYNDTEHLHNEKELKGDTDTEYYNVIPVKRNPTNNTDIDPEYNVYENA